MIQQRKISSHQTSSGGNMKHQLQLQQPSSLASSYSLNLNAAAAAQNSCSSSAKALSNGLHTERQQQPRFSQSQSRKTASKRAQRLPSGSQKSQQRQIAQRNQHQQPSLDHQQRQMFQDDTTERQEQFNNGSLNLNHSSHIVVQQNQYSQQQYQQVSSRSLVGQNYQDQTKDINNSSQGNRRRIGNLHQTIQPNSIQAASSNSNCISDPNLFQSHRYASQIRHNTIEASAASAVEVQQYSSSVRNLQTTVNNLNNTLSNTRDRQTNDQLHQAAALPPLGKYLMQRRNVQQLVQPSSTEQDHRESSLKSSTTPKQRQQVSLSQKRSQTKRQTTTNIVHNNNIINNLQLQHPPAAPQLHNSASAKVTLESNNSTSQQYHFGGRSYLKAPRVGTNNFTNTHSSQSSLPVPKSQPQYHHQQPPPQQKQHRLISGLRRRRIDSKAVALNCQQNGAGSSQQLDSLNSLEDNRKQNLQSYSSSTLKKQLADAQNGQTQSGGGRLSIVSSAALNFRKSSVKRIRGNTQGSNVRRGAQSIYNNSTFNIPIVDVKENNRNSSMPAMPLQDEISILNSNNLSQKTLVAVQTAQSPEQVMPKPVVTESKSHRLHLTNKQPAFYNNHQQYQQNLQLAQHQPLQNQYSQQQQQRSNVQQQIYQSFQERRNQTCTKKKLQTNYDAPTDETSLISGQQNVKNHSYIFSQKPQHHTTAIKQKVQEIQNKAGQAEDTKKGFFIRQDSLFATSNDTNSGIRITNQRQQEHENEKKQDIMSTGQFQEQKPREAAQDQDSKDGSSISMQQLHQSLNGTAVQRNVGVVKGNTRNHNSMAPTEHHSSSLIIKNQQESCSYYDGAPVEYKIEERRAGSRPRVRFTDPSGACFRSHDHYQRQQRFHNHQKQSLPHDFLPIGQRTSKKPQKQHLHHTFKNNYNHNSQFSDEGSENFAQIQQPQMQYSLSHKQQPNSPHLGQQVNNDEVMEQQITQQPSNCGFQAAQNHQPDMSYIQNASSNGNFFSPNVLSCNSLSPKDNSNNFMTLGHHLNQPMLHHFNSLEPKTATFSPQENLNIEQVKNTRMQPQYSSLEQSIQGIIVSHENNVSQTIGSTSQVQTANRKIRKNQLITRRMSGPAARMFPPGFFPDNVSNDSKETPLKISIDSGGDQQQLQNKANQSFKKNLHRSKEVFKQISAQLKQNEALEKAKALVQLQQRRQQLNYTLSPTRQDLDISKNCLYDNTTCRPEEKSLLSINRARPLLPYETAVDLEGSLGVQPFISNNNQNSPLKNQQLRMESNENQTTTGHETTMNTNAAIENTELNRECLQTSPFSIVDQMSIDRNSSQNLTKNPLDAMSCSLKLNGSKVQSQSFNSSSLKKQTINNTINNTTFSDRVQKNIIDNKKSSQGGRNDLTRNDNQQLVSQQKSKSPIQMINNPNIITNQSVTTQQRPDISIGQLSQSTATAASSGAKLKINTKLTHATAEIVRKPPQILSVKNKSVSQEIGSRQLNISGRLQLGKNKLHHMQNTIKLKSVQINRIGEAESFEPSVIAQSSQASQQQAHLQLQKIQPENSSYSAICNTVQSQQKPGQIVVSTSLIAAQSGTCKDEVDESYGNKQMTIFDMAAIASSGGGGSSSGANSQQHHQGIMTFGNFASLIKEQTSWPASQSRKENQQEGSCVNL